MALSEPDHDMTRRYLLGQLTDDEEQMLEERLLSEDDLFQEVELTKDELAQEYASGELSTKERKWLQENFLASPEGKQRHDFAKTFDQYVKNHPAQRQIGPSLIERLRNFWTAPKLATTAAAVVMAVVLFLIIPSPTPPGVAYLTVTNSPGERSSASGAIQRIKLNGQALELKLMLPEPASPGSAYRVELSNDVSKGFETRAQDSQSITVQIPPNQLPRGQYSAQVSTIDANGNAHRIPGSYYFIVE